MRPPVKIIVVDTNELRLSLLRLALRVRNFAILDTSSAAEAAAFARDLAPAVLIVHWPTAGINVPEMLAAVRLADPDVRTLVLQAGRMPVPDSVFATCVMHRRFAVADIFDQLRVLCARKRGPRKDAMRKPVATVAAANLITRRTA